MLIETSTDSEQHTGTYTLDNCNEIELVWEKECKVGGVLTRLRSRVGDHVAEVGRRGASANDGRTEERVGGSAARAKLVAAVGAAPEPQHFEIAHLAGNAVPLTSHRIGL